MQFSTLSTVVEELSVLLPNTRIHRVFEGADKTIFILFKNGRSELVLLISPDRALPRLYLAREKPHSVPNLHPFTQFLKSRMAGGTVRSIGLLNQDRVVELLFTRQGRQFTLLFEVLSNAANLIITDESSSILAVYYPAPVSGKVSRPLLPGFRYEPPLKKLFHPEKNKDALFEQHGKVTDADRDEEGANPRNRAAEIFYTRLLQQKRFESARSEVLALTRRLQAKAGRRSHALLQDQATALDAEMHKRAGNAILANLKAISHGQSQALLSNFDGETVEVKLDPGRSPADNAERYFRKYKKAKAALQIIALRLGQAKEELIFLERLRSELERAAEEEELLDVKSLLIEKGYLLSPRKIGGKKKSLQVPYRKVLHCGWEILIGKNSAGNDLITTRLARVSDLWFHAEGLPGSHVIIRNPEAREIPSEVIEKAAGLAAFYSRGRSGTKVAVTYTFARFVKKPKGAKSGLVTLSERKTMMAVPSAE